MSENFQIFEFHNTFTKNIYQTHNSICQNSFLNYHSLSVFISHISCTSIVTEMSEATSMNVSIIFQGVTTKLCVELFQRSPLPLQTVPYVMSHCTVTANSSMSHFVISGRGKMRIVLSLATVSNTGLFVPPLDGCNACVI